MTTEYSRTRFVQIDVPPRPLKRILFSRALAGYLLLAFCAIRPTAQTRAAWAWMGGSDTINQPGNYGTLGTPADGNLPPCRWNAAAWTDKDGNLWLFGGSGYDPATNGMGTFLNDLWKYSPSLKQWTWMGGNRIAETHFHGVYGTRGDPSKGNIPGARTEAVSWTDIEGNFWLFGGRGYDAMGHTGGLNDLWEYSPASREWTWMSGSVTVSKEGGRPGVYGLLALPSPNNTPGARSNAVGWTDQTGNLWLFGGNGYDADGAGGILADLWEFQPDLNEWVWMGGSNKAPKSVGWPGVYGPLGIVSPAYRPGSRYGAVAWTDESGNLWLFGGSGYDKDGIPVNLDDVWEFIATRRGWAWLGGSDTPLECSRNNSPILTCKGEAGVYGKLGQPAHENTPGRRTGAAAWRDSNGNFWLFGGQGYDAVANQGSLDDMWRFDPGTGEWTWMGGNSAESGCGPIPAGGTFCFGRHGEYGSLGVPDPANNPGARTEAATWVDKQGNLWLFGGYGVDRTGKSMGALGDLWEYRQPAAMDAPAAPRARPLPQPPPKPKPPS